MQHIPNVIDRLLGESFQPNPALLLDTDRFAEIGGLEIPLYSDLLGQEAQIVQAMRTAVDGIESKIDAVVDRYDAIYPSKASKATRRQRVVESYHTKTYITSEVTEIPFDPETIGYTALVELAAKLGISRFMSYAVVLNGEIVSDFNDIITDCDDYWINIGVQGVLPIDRANAVLNGLPFHTYAEGKTYPIDQIDESILTYADIDFYHTIVDPVFTIYAIVYVRTGNASQFLDYMPLKKVQAFVAEIEAELADNPAIQTNAEVPIVESKGEGENPPLESVKNTGTSPSKPAKKSS